MRRRWVTCDTNLPGAKVLQQTVDEQGNFWYHHQAKNIVDKFYKTCKPDCAGEKDWWDRVGQVCVSVDTALNEWVEVRACPSPAPNVPAHALLHMHAQPPISPNSASRNSRSLPPTRPSPPTRRARTRGQTAATAPRAGA